MSEEKRSPPPGFLEVGRHGACRRRPRRRGRRGPASPRPRVPTQLSCLLSWVFLLLLFFPAGAGAAVRRDLGEGVVVVVGDDHRLWVEARPLTSEGLYAFARRLCGDREAATAVAEANDGVEHLLAGVRYRVPFELLTPQLQRRAVGVLFADDTAAADGWRHTAGIDGAPHQESLWYLAEWFTGSGENYRAIREYNGMIEEEVIPGQTVVIPAELLRPAFRGALPETSVLARAELETPTAEDFGLDYDRDTDGEFAGYRLRPGEALYSSVVVRFTGHLVAADVNSLAADIATRSGIRDVTDIPVGYRVKIPFDLLLPEFLPTGHPRRLAYEQGLEASSQFSNRVLARGLEGITVILDAGHGGRDVGASMGGVWESTYVYDVALRVRQLLADHTAAAVVVTTRDGERFSIHDRDVLPYSRGHAVMTDPPYPIEDSRTGVNLRWYLANSVYRTALRRSSDPEKAVFVSIHADSLHPSVRGATIYIPGADMTGGNYGKSGAIYQARREYREGPRVEFAYRERVKSEGLSRQLAEDVLERFRAHGLGIHPTKPIREKIIRQRSAWVPAVLRYNAVPAKVLVEIGNLANDQDRRLMQTRAWRQQVAEAVVEGILDYYGAAAAAAPAQVATAAGK